MVGSGWLPSVWCHYFFSFFPFQPEWPGLLPSWCLLMQANGQNLQVLSGISGITRIDDPSKSDAAACMCAILGPSGAGGLLRLVRQPEHRCSAAPKRCFILCVSHLAQLRQCCCPAWPLHLALGTQAACKRCPVASPNPKASCPHGS